MKEDSYIFDINPMGKPRMTRRDKWKNTRTKAAQRYFEYKDELKKIALVNRFKPSNAMELAFYIPMPRSWSEKKRKEMNLTPHMQKPDRDNLEKAFLDTFFDNDATSWYGITAKYWTNDPIGRIVVVHI